MNIDDYETLPTTSAGINMSAGALAGVLEHCVMYPMDSIKTRMQSLSPVTSGYSIATTFRNMIKNEGYLRPIRGVTAVVAGAGPAHALYFGSYEFAKELMTKVTKYNNVNYMASGALATLIHDAVSNPTDVIKQRMQMYNSPYKSVIKCLVDVYRKEGIEAFYRSYSTQLVMNIPYQTIHFTTYEFLQNMMNHERKYNPVVHMLAGGTAGAAAAAITTPLDVVKTLLNTQERGYTKDMMQAIKQIYSVAGPRGFFKGITARVLYAMPATAICWSTYEFFKFYFCGIGRDEYKSSVSGKNALKPRSTHHTPLQAATAYVLPSATTASADSAAVTLNETSPLKSKATVNAQAATTPSPNQPPPISPSGPIKTVCELSSSVASPKMNLHTRHTEVKSPYDRGFST